MEERLNWHNWPQHCGKGKGLWLFRSHCAALLSIRATRMTLFLCLVYKCSCTFLQWLAFEMFTGKILGQYISVCLSNEMPWPITIVHQLWLSLCSCESKKQTRNKHGARAWTQSDDIPYTAHCDEERKPMTIIFLVEGKKYQELSNDVIFFFYFVFADLTYG